MEKKKNSTDKNQIKPLGNKNLFFKKKKQTLLPKKQSIKKHIPCEKNLQKKNLCKKNLNSLQKKNSQRKHAKEKQKINVLNETSPFTEKTFFIARKKTLTKETATSLKKIETKNIFSKKKVKKTFLKKMKLSPYFCYVVLFLLKKTQTFDKKDFEKNLKKKHEKKNLVKKKTLVEKKTIP